MALRPIATKYGRDEIVNYGLNIALDQAAGIRERSQLSSRLNKRNEALRRYQAEYATFGEKPTPEQQDQILFKMYLDPALQDSTGSGGSGGRGSPFRSGGRSTAAGPLDTSAFFGTDTPDKAKADAEVAPPPAITTPAPIVTPAKPISNQFGTGAPVRPDNPEGFIPSEQPSAILKSAIEGGKEGVTTALDRTKQFIDSPVETVRDFAQSVPALGRTVADQTGEIAKTTFDNWIGSGRSLYELNLQVVDSLFGTNFSQTNPQGTVADVINDPSVPFDAKLKLQESLNNPSGNKSLSVQPDHTAPTVESTRNDLLRSLRTPQVPTTPTARDTLIESLSNTGNSVGTPTVESTRQHLLDSLADPAAGRVLPDQSLGERRVVNPSVGDLTRQIAELRGQVVDTRGLTPEQQAAVLPSNRAISEQIGALNAQLGATAPEVVVPAAISPIGDPRVPADVQTRIQQGADIRRDELETTIAELEAGQPFPARRGPQTGFNASDIRTGVNTGLDLTRFNKSSDEIIQDARRELEGLPPRVTPAPAPAPPVVTPAVPDQTRLTPQIQRVADDIQSTNPDITPESASDTANFLSRLSQLGTPSVGGGFDTVPPQGILDAFPQEFPSSPAPPTAREVRGERNARIVNSTIEQNAEDTRTGRLRPVGSDPDVSFPVEPPEASRIRQIMELLVPAADAAQVNRSIDPTVEGGEQLVESLTAYSDYYGLPPTLAYSIATQETNFGQNTNDSEAGARGSMQVFPAGAGSAVNFYRDKDTGEIDLNFDVVNTDMKEKIDPALADQYELVKFADLTPDQQRDNKYNIPVAMSYLNQAFVKEKGDVTNAAAYYNGGPSWRGLKARGGNVKENNEYKANVSKLYLAMQKLRGGTGQ